MKKIKKSLALVLAFTLILSYTSIAMAVSQENLIKEEVRLQQLEKVHELELKFNAEIKPDPRYGDKYLEPENLAKIEAFLEAVNKPQPEPKRQIIRMDKQALSAEGSYNTSWYDDWDLWLTLDNISWRMKGTSRIDGSYTVTYSNNKVYVTGSVTGADFVGETLGSPSFWSGSLGIQGSGTGLASLSPQATLKFSVPIGYAITSYLYTFYSSYWIFY